MVQLLNMTIHQQAINISTSSGMSYNAQLLLHENMEKVLLCVDVLRTHSADFLNTYANFSQMKPTFMCAPL